MLQKLTTTPTGMLRKCAPKPVWQWWRTRRDEADNRHRAETLRAAVQGIRALEQGEVPGAELLGQLREGWGNPDYAAELSYLKEVARLAVLAERPILECGTGVTTLLIALLAGSRGVPIYCLEHDKQWADHVNRTLTDLDIAGADVLFAPIISYGEFHWYSAPIYLLPDRFDLVICDGPPERGTHGGRFGLMPVLGERFDRDTKILVDDTATQAGSTMVNHWCATGRWCSELSVPEQRGMALLTRADAGMLADAALAV